MSGYLAKRLLGAIPTLLGVSVLTFAFIRLIPGDAIAARLGTSTALTPEQLASLRAYFDIAQRLPATLELAFAAAVIAIAVGVPLGLLSALKPRSRLDLVARIGGLV